MYITYGFYTEVTFAYKRMQQYIYEVWNDMDSLSFNTAYFYHLQESYINIILLA